MQTFLNNSSINTEAASVHDVKGHPKCPTSVPGEIKKMENVTKKGTAMTWMPAQESIITNEKNYKGEGSGHG